MKSLVIIFLIFIINSTTQEIHAQARKYSNCEQSKKIEDPINSQGYYLNSECTVAYVKPPVEGVIKVSSYIQSLTDDGCRSEMVGINMLNAKVFEVEKASRNLDKAKKGLSKKHVKIKKIKSMCDQFKQMNRKIDISSSKLEQRIVEINIFISNLISDNENCKENKTLNCLEDDGQANRFVTELKKLETYRQKMNLDKENNSKRLAACENRIEAEIALIESEDKGYSEEEDRLFTALEEYRKTLQTSTGELLQQPGGQLSVSLVSGQYDLVKKYKELNSNLDVDFQPMPISNAILSFNQVNDGLKAMIPTVLQANVHGVAVQDEKNEEGLDPDDLSPNIEKDIKFGEALGGQIIINKYMACSLVDLDKSQKLENIAGAIKPSVTFNYGVQVDRKLKIKYEESHLYQIIRKNTSKRGLFRSSSSSSVTEKSEAEKWIQIELASQDEKVGFENSEKLAMDIRREFLDAALMKVAKGYLSNQQANLIDPGPDGATLAAKELQKCPHMYCQFGAIVLNIGSALLGGSKAESNMTQIVSAKESQEIIDKKMVVEYGTQTLSIREQ